MPVIDNPYTSADGRVFQIGTNQDEIIRHEMMLARKSMPTATKSVTTATVSSSSSSNNDDVIAGLILSQSMLLQAIQNALTMADIRVTLQNQLSGMTVPLSQAKNPAAVISAFRQNTQNLIAKLSGN